MAPGKSYRPVPLDIEMLPSRHQNGSDRGRAKPKAWYDLRPTMNHPKLLRTPGSEDDIYEEDLGLLNGEESYYETPLPELPADLDSKRYPIWQKFLFGFVILIAAGGTIVTFGLLAQLLRAGADYQDPLSDWGKQGTGTEYLSWYPTDFLRDTVPIPCHSHNDYWRKVPLYSALYTGCISVEADIWKFDGDDDLYVGHNTASLTSNRTFESLYIQPLVEILEHQNPATKFYDGELHGVFDVDPEQALTLLVDLKTDGEKTWPILIQQLEPLRERGWLTFMEDGEIHQRPITVVGTGATRFDLLMANTTYRDIFYDAPINTMYLDPSDMDNTSDRPPPPPEDNSNTDTESDSSPFEETNDKLQKSRSRTRGQGAEGTSLLDDYTPQNSYYASASFQDEFGFLWWSKLSSKQLRKLRGQINGAHAKGLKARYYETPAWPRSLRNHIWRVLTDQGVDILNVDDLDSAKSGTW